MSSKILSRIRFIQKKELPSYVDESQYPIQAGGTIDKDPVTWVRKRLSEFPRLPGQKSDSDAADKGLVAAATTTSEIDPLADLLGKMSV
eukprot:UC1_evm1s1804